MTNALPFGDQLRPPPHLVLPARPAALAEGGRVVTTYNCPPPRGYWQELIDSWPTRLVGFAVLALIGYLLVGAVLDVPAFGLRRSGRRGAARRLPDPHHRRGRQRLPHPRAPRLLRRTRPRHASLRQQRPWRSPLPPRAPRAEVRAVPIRLRQPVRRRAAPTTTANARKASGTTPRSSAWPVAVSTSCTRCSAPAPPTSAAAPPPSRSNQPPTTKPSAPPLDRAHRDTPRPTPAGGRRDH